MLIRPNCIAVGNPLRFYTSLLIFFFLIVGTNASYAWVWTVTPRVGVEGIYTDNIDLSADNERKEFITRFTPGVSVTERGGGVEANIDYTLEELIYFRDSYRNGRFHQLSGDAQAELVKDTLFFNADGSYRQQIENSSGRLSLDNINSDNRTDVAVLNLGPRLHKNFSNKILSDLEYRYGIIEYRGGTTSDVTSNQIDFSARNGAYFDRFLWRGNINTSDINRETAADSTRESVDAEMSYRVVPTLSLLTRGGYENDDVPTSGVINNGSYWSAGFIWAPAPGFTLDATYGERNKDANLNWRPLERTSLEIHYRDRDVGVDDNVSWSGSLIHRRIHSVWELQYTEDVTNLQTLQLDNQQLVVLTDLAGNVMTDPDTGLPLLLFENFYLTADEDFVRKRYNISVGLEGVRNNLVLASYIEKQQFEVSRNEKKLFGGNISLRTRLAPRTYSTLSGELQRRESVTNNNDDDEIFRISLGVSRQLRPDLTGAVEYQHIESDSTPDVNDYRENRVSMRVNKVF